MKNNSKSFRTHLDEEYGLIGTAQRAKYEADFEAFKLGVMLQELRKEQGLSQKELALTNN